MFRGTLLLFAGCALVVASCGAPMDSSTGGDRAEAPSFGASAVAEHAADGSVRLPYLGGAFVTRGPEMPIEVEQAIAGRRTDRPVVVWAGD